MDEGVFVIHYSSLSCFNMGMALILALNSFPVAMNDDGDDSDKDDHVDNCQCWFEQRSLNLVPSFCSLPSSLILLCPLMPVSFSHNISPFYLPLSGNFPALHY